MPKWFSLTAARNHFFRHSFVRAGLQSSFTDLGDGTTIHCWIPRNRALSKPTLVLIHGLGTNAMWQWNEFLPPLIARFNVYVPDLLFFGDSHTTRPERSEHFQAQCVMRVLESHEAARGLYVVGISYGGFVAYSLAEQFMGRVERLVLSSAGVCLEEKDMEDGLLGVKSVEEAVEILLPQTPEKLRELLKILFHKPARGVPSCFLNDFIDVMCTENRQEKKEIIQALLKDRKMSDLPKIMQPTLIVWGEHDQIFPVELARRLKRHLGENAELVIIKNAGHAINIEKSRELSKHLKAFLIDALAASEINHSNVSKTD